MPASIFEVSNPSGDNSTLSIYPNPSNDYSTIGYHISNNSNVTISIYNALGQIMETDEEGKQASGYYRKTISLSKFESGIYFVQLTTENAVEQKKMVVIK